MNNVHSDSPAALAAALRARGLAGSAAALLDAFAPFAAFGAQALYVAQPLAGLLNRAWRAPLGGLAAILETPDGVRALQAALIEPDPPPRV